MLSRERKDSRLLRTQNSLPFDMRACVKVVTDSLWMSFDIRISRSTLSLCASPKVLSPSLSLSSLSLSSSPHLVGPSLTVLPLDASMHSVMTD